jgi:hypothetical protein
MWFRPRARAQIGVQHGFERRQPLDRGDEHEMLESLAPVGPEQTPGEPALVLAPESVTL